MHDSQKDFKNNFTNYSCTKSLTPPCKKSNVPLKVAPDRLTWMLTPDEVACCDATEGRCRLASNRQSPKQTSSKRTASSEKIVRSRE